MSTINTASIPKLTSRNYSQWSFIIEPFLTEAGIDITSDNGIPEGKEGTALRIIRSSVSDEAIPFIKEIKGAKATWDRLNEKFGQTDQEGRFTNLLQFFSIQKKPNENIAAFVNRAHCIYNVINATSVKREDNVRDQFEITEVHLIVAILNGLPAEIRTSILRRLDRSRLTFAVLDLSIQEYDFEQRIGSKESPIDVSSSEKKKNWKSKKKLANQQQQNTNSAPFCKKCKRKGHLTKDCRPNLPITSK